MDRRGLPGVDRLTISWLQAVDPTGPALRATRDNPKGDLVSDYG
jgi:hypothetical protein